MKVLNDLKICIKGAGEMATGVAWRLFKSNFRKIVMLDIAVPMSIRRNVSFSQAVLDGVQTVEGVTAVRKKDFTQIEKAWEDCVITVFVDPQWKILESYDFDVLIDAIIAKKNIGTTKNDASLVIGIGPGFEAGNDVHIAIESNRGHDLGRIIETGSPAKNTGEPGNIGGYTFERVIRAPETGKFEALKDIGEIVEIGEIIGKVQDIAVKAAISGVIRGLIRDGIFVEKGVKIGDIDPRKIVAYCSTISDKSRAIAGSVLEAVLRKYN